METIIEVRKCQNMWSNMTEGLLWLYHKHFQSVQYSLHHRMEDRLACRFQNRRPLKVSTRRYRALSEGQVCLGTTLDGREGRSATLLSSWGSGRSPCSRRLHTLTCSCRWSCLCCWCWGRQALYQGRLWCVSQAYSHRCYISYVMNFDRKCSWFYHFIMHFILWHHLRVSQKIWEAKSCLTTYNAQQ